MANKSPYSPTGEIQHFHIDEASCYDAIPIWLLLCLDTNCVLFRVVLAIQSE